MIPTAAEVDVWTGDAKPLAPSHRSGLERDRQVIDGSLVRAMTPAAMAASHGSVANAASASVTAPVVPSPARNRWLWANTVAARGPRPMR